jgi:hypothetical protein
MDDIQQALEQAETFEPFVQKPLAAILDDTAEMIGSFVKFPTYSKEDTPPGMIVSSLWTAHTHTYQHVEVTPYLNIWSPTMEAGKTTLLEVFDEVVHNPLFFASATLAAVTREIAATNMTLLSDEGDKANKEVREELTGIMNAGYKKSGKRLVINKADMTTAKLSQYCPKAFAGIGSGTLAETLRSRSIPIELRKKRTSEKTLPNIQRIRTEHGAPIRLQLEGWAANPDIIPYLSKIADEIPDELGDRERDCWEPLFNIADLAGGAWPKMARSAAIAINANRQIQMSYPEMLLSDIYKIFTTLKVDKIFIQSLLSRLHEMEDRPWGSFMQGDKPMTSNELANKLRDFYVSPASVRIGTQVLSGYTYTDFKESFERHVKPHVDSRASDDPEPEPETETAQPVVDVVDVRADTPTQSSLLMSLDTEDLTEEVVNAE